MEMLLIICFVAGAAGALAKDILQDNSLVLPRIVNGNFSLGFLGGMVTGGLAGYLIDGNPTTAFLAGYAGTSVIENLLSKKNSQKSPIEGVTEKIIIKIAKREGIDPALAVRVARCESNLKTTAENVNASGSRDRGLFQINDKWHPSVSDEEAFNPIFATEFFCKAVSEGHLDWWNATRSCWELDTPA